MKQGFFCFPCLWLVLAYISSVNAMATTEKTLFWEDLVPEKGKGKPIFIAQDKEVFGLPDRKGFDGSDEDYDYLVESLEAIRYQQPVGAFIKPELDGKIVKIPGYITPLSFVGGKIEAFLLVPYHGACIHVPPPPGNQIIFVAKAKGVVEDELYMPVWITGTMRAKPVGTAVANVGYSMEDVVVELYEVR